MCTRNTHFVMCVPSLHQRGRRWSYCTTGSYHLRLLDSSKPYLHNRHKGVRVRWLEVVALSAPLRLVVPMDRTPEIDNSKIHSNGAHTMRQHASCRSLPAIFLRRLILSVAIATRTRDSPLPPFPSPFLLRPLCPRTRVTRKLDKTSLL